MGNLWRSLNSWIRDNGDYLRSWAALIQLIFIPATVFAFIFSTLQFNKFISKADLHLEFSNQRSLTFRVRNVGSTVAQKPQWGFVLMDCDESMSVGHLVPVPIPWKEGTYIRGKNSLGPFSVLGPFGQGGHRYFGWAKVFSENSRESRTYWIHFTSGEEDNSWVSESGPGSEELYSFTDLSEEALKQRFPRRTLIN